ncbi:hypothetical protein BGZ49_006975 [Haplosporangium sp. Z 27]|nr:hypothetical protein BGZ49_006975 [Haplosporangium sp. Z 27]
MATQLKLWCLVEDTTDPFSVEIYSNNTVEDLKKKVFTRARFGDIPPESLQLWRADIPTLDDDDPEYYAQSVNGFTSDNKNKFSNPAHYMSAKFPGGSLPNTIQVIVRKPSLGMTSLQDND